MSLKLLSVLFLILTCVTAQCPRRCDCFEYMLQSHIVCANKSLTQVPNFSIAFFNELENIILNLDENNIKTIAKFAFGGLTKLKHLYISRNNISIIPHDAFDDNEALQALNLGRNPNLQLPDTGFILPNLIDLKLDFCGLQHIPADFFKNMTNLQFIWLEANQLSTFDSRLIVPLNKIKTLDLSENQLSSIEFDVGQMFSSRHWPDYVSVLFFGNPVRCDCNFKSAMNNNKEKNINVITDCAISYGPPLRRWLREHCTNQSLSTSVATTTIPTTVSSTPQ